MMPEHLFDDRTQLRYIVWHEDPPLERFMRQIIDAVRPSVFIETGSHMGWTSMWLARNYPDMKIETVEVDDRFYGKAKDNLERFPNVSITHADSREFLQKRVSGLLRELEHESPFSKSFVPMFWLDAHWWPPVPLKDECRQVALLPKYVCLLDDFSCWGPDFSGDTFFSIAPSSGDAYLNDISYVAAELGEIYYRPIWEPRPGSKGVGLFVKGVDYVPPVEFMRRETLDEFIPLRGASVLARAAEPGFVAYPLHPSCGKKLP
jgi:hypothetical protein